MITLQEKGGRVRKRAEKITRITEGWGWGVNTPSQLLLLIPPPFLFVMMMITDTIIKDIIQIIQIFSGVICY